MAPSDDRYALVEQMSQFYEFFNMLLMKLLNMHPIQELSFIIPRRMRYDDESF